MFAKIINDVVEKYPYSIGQLRKDNPNVSFPKNPSPETLAAFNAFEVVRTPQPEVDYTKNVGETVPQKINGVWTQVWNVTDASEEEIAQRLKDMVPAEVTMRQARLALFEQGLLAQVDAALSNIPDETERTKAQIEWEYATVVERNAVLTQSLGAAMGMTEEQLDQLFIFAATL